MGCGGRQGWTQLPTGPACRHHLCMCAAAGLLRLVMWRCEAPCAFLACDHPSLITHPEPSTHIARRRSSRPRPAPLLGLSHRAAAWRWWSRSSSRRSSSRMATRCAHGSHVLLLVGEQEGVGCSASTPSSSDVAPAQCACDSTPPPPLPPHGTPPDRPSPCSRTRSSRRGTWRAAPTARSTTTSWWSSLAARPSTRSWWSG